jgi:hypothetical protein
MLHAMAAASCAPSPPARFARAAAARPSAAGPSMLPCRRRPAFSRGGCTVAMAGKESRLKKTSPSLISTPVRLGAFGSAFRGGPTLLTRRPAEVAAAAARRAARRAAGSAARRCGGGGACGG